MAAAIPKRADAEQVPSEEPTYSPLYVPGKGERPFVSQEVPGHRRKRAFASLLPEGEPALLPFQSPRNLLHLPRIPRAVQTQ